MPRLVEAYLDYRSRNSGQGFPADVPNEANQKRADPSATIGEMELIDLFCTSSHNLG
jgi:hypothetical protein